MRILYAIQGTGNGHVCRAKELIPCFVQRARVDVLVSGTQMDIGLPFAARHRCKGLGFIFGRNGGIDRWATFRSAARGGFIREVRDLPVTDYDLVVNDFEPVSAWAARLRGVPCIALSHQSAVLKGQAPRPAATDRMGLTILRHYAPAQKSFGFHFQRYDHDTFTPIIRKQVRGQRIAERGHFTVYLPAYEDKRLLAVLGKCGSVNWEVFSKHCRTAYTYGNVRVSPVVEERFVCSMANSTGVLCGAGFETPAEALYLRKKLMVVPMSGQYEQQCNAAALARLGVPVLKHFDADHVDAIKAWLETDNRVDVDYPDNTRDVVNEVLSHYCRTVADPGMAGEDLLAELAAG